MNMIKALSDDNAAVTIDSVPIGTVARARELELWSEHSVFGFGDSEPSAVLKYDRHYRIELYRDGALDEAALTPGFTLSVNGRVYADCCCTAVERTKNADGTEEEHITIYAKKKQEAQDGQ